MTKKRMLELFDILIDRIIDNGVGDVTKVQEDLIERGFTEKEAIELDLFVRLRGSYNRRPMRGHKCKHCKALIKNVDDFGVKRYVAADGDDILCYMCPECGKLCF